MRALGAAAIVLCGCASMPSVGPLRTALNEEADQMNRLGAGLSAACAGDPEPRWCVDSLDAFAKIAKAHSAAQDVCDAIDAVSR